MMKPYNDPMPMPARGVFAIDRRRLLAGAGAGALAALTPRRAGAMLNIDINQGNIQPMPIALPDFVAGTPDELETARNVTAVITNDLQRSGLFAPINPQAYVEKITNTDAVPRFADWRVINAQALVTGRLTRQGDGRLQGRIPPVGRVRRQADSTASSISPRPTIGAASPTSSPTRSTRRSPARRAISTAASSSSTRAGRSSSASSASPSWTRTASACAISRAATNWCSPRASIPRPRKSPTCPMGRASPSVYLLNIETGQREVVGNFPGMSFAPRFSPDGQRVIMSLQQGANANLFVMDLRSKQTTRLTDTPAIDTAPCYSPDGQHICFESDRGGSQQIYVMPAAGGQATRISFGQGRHAGPVWSPRGDYIAFTGMIGNQFAIGMLKPDGSGERILTEGFHNEGPTFAPNGRVIMFFRDLGPGPFLYTIDITGRNELKEMTPSYASDPAWSPLLS